MSKEIQLQICNNIQKYYDCRIIIDEEKEPFTLFCAADIGKILGRINIRTTLSTNCNKVIIKTRTNGGEQNVTFITFDGLHKLISKCRKPSVIDFCNKVEIDMNFKVYTSIELDTMRCITDAFNGEEMIHQYKVSNYMVDLYFPKYQIIVECDEKHHNRTANKINDVCREQNIKFTIIECVFIRYDPYSRNFNIFEVINNIYKIIVNKRIYS